jgi:hypothetical protein
VPRSRIRRRPDYTPPPRRREAVARLGGGRWVVPTMLTLLIVGLLWICAYYLAGERIPGMTALGPWNLAIGMGLITGGFLVSTRWK